MSLTLVVIVLLALLCLGWGGWGRPRYAPTYGYGVGWSPLVVLVVFIVVLWALGILR